MRRMSRSSIRRLAKREAPPPSPLLHRSIGITAGLEIVSISRCSSISPDALRPSVIRAESESRMDAGILFRMTELETWRPYEKPLQWALFIYWIAWLGWLISSSLHGLHAMSAAQLWAGAGAFFSRSLLAWYAGDVSIYSTFYRERQPFGFWYAVSTYSVLGVALLWAGFVESSDERIVAAAYEPASPALAGAAECKPEPRGMNVEPPAFTRPSPTDNGSVSLSYLVQADGRLSDLHIREVAGTPKVDRIVLAVSKWRYESVASTCRTGTTVTVDYRPTS
ncbi:MAG: hypothetical protein JSS29_19700 [Proteobacteria bacterium]|nr:hypothetical protein [Pseudomonadota bacterium]